MKKPKILLLHGWGGSDFPHWQSWLAGELAKNYGNVHFLEFSHFDFPDLAVWKSELQKALQDFKPDIVICHSLANTLWFHLQSEIQEVQKLYLVAPPSFSCNVAEIQAFFPLALPTQTSAKEAQLICADNDPYITLEEVKKLQKSLGIPLHIVKGAGHLNTQSGYGEWPWILAELQKACQKLS